MVVFRGRLISVPTIGFLFYASDLDRWHIGPHRVRQGVHLFSREGAEALDGDHIAGILELLQVILSGSLDPPGGLQQALPGVQALFLYFNSYSTAPESR